jgi:hypothetical protein
MSAGGNVADVLRLIWSPGLLRFLDMCASFADRCRPRCPEFWDTCGTGVLNTTTVLWIVTPNR